MIADDIEIIFETNMADNFNSVFRKNYFLGYCECEFNWQLLQNSSDVIEYLVGNELYIAR